MNRVGGEWRLVCKLQNPKQNGIPSIHPRANYLKEKFLCKFLHLFLQHVESAAHTTHTWNDSCTFEVDSFYE